MVVGPFCHMIEPVLLGQVFEPSTCVLRTSTSDTTSSGIPYHALCALSLLMTVETLRAALCYFQL